jgi:hypothetical protein
VGDDGGKLAAEPALRQKGRMKLKYLAIGAGVSLLAFCMGLWIGGLPIATLKDAAGLAPLGTAIIAFCAVVMAGFAVFVQRDTAQRRAAIDFFLKTETDDGLIDAYAAFHELLPKIPEIIGRPSLSYSDKDYKALRKWLNLCELIAVGIRLGGFSRKVAYDYWGYVLLDSYAQGLPLIEYIRKTAALGGPKTFFDLEKLSKCWAKKDDRSTPA